jgi:O-6-methylguanine DNA methyltransferase
MPDHHAVMTTLDGRGAPFRVAATKEGVVAAGWEGDVSTFIGEVAGRIHGPVVPLAESLDDDPAAIVLRDALPTFETLLSGRPVDPTTVRTDLGDRPEFDRRVLGEVREVGWGETASYGDIARRIGQPRAARAVGGALGRNPISLLIPCHRIIAGDGTLGGYGGTGWVDRDRQRSRKEALLLREGVTVPRRDG